MAALLLLRTPLCSPQTRCMWHRGRAKHICLNWQPVSQPRKAKSCACTDERASNSDASVLHDCERMRLLL